MAKSSTNKGRRAVVIGGLRTPFCKAFSDLTKLDTIALGAAAVSGLLKKLELNPKEIDAISWGGLLYSAFLSIGLAYLLWYRGVSRLGGSPDYWAADIGSPRSTRPFRSRSRV